MAVIASGSKTIIDLSDGKSLSVYLGANQPKTQIYNKNLETYTPDWTTTSGKLRITPIVYANQTRIDLSDTALTITWKRKEGSGTEANLTTGETVSGNALTVSQNKMASITSGLLTYVATVTYLDPDTGLTINATADISFACISTGEDAKTAWISGEQVFKYSALGGTPSPAQITMNANIQGVTVLKWQYKDSSGEWQDYPTTSDNATISGNSIIVKPTHGIWVNDVASLRLLTSDSNIYDVTSIYKVVDGSQGVAAPTVFLTNENITFAGNASGLVSSVTKTCNVVAYVGTNKTTPVIGTITGAPTGMNISVGETVNNEVPITISIPSASNLGGSGQLQGEISVPITSPVSTTLKIQWSKVNTGASGTGAFVLTVYSPDGTVFTNGTANGGTSITLKAQFFQGSTDRTASSSVLYLWQKYSSGSWVTFKEEAAGSSDGSTCTVDASDVTGTATFRCRARYGSSSSTYFYDTITVIDKTDNYQADIDSTAGDVFKNTVGETCLICRLWQNGKEVDPLKSTNFSTAAPSSPSAGQFYYRITKTTHVVALMRYSGSAWVDVSTNTSYKHEKTYKWYRRDKDGNPLDGGAVFATGKVIFIDGDDVDVKTVFVCEVE